MKRWSKLLTIGAALLVLVALACSSADDDAAPAAPAPAPQAPAPQAPAAAPAPVAPAAPQAPAPAAPAAPALPAAPGSSGPAAAPAPAPTAVRAIPQEPASGDIKRGGHLNVGYAVPEFTNLNPATTNQVRQFQLERQIIGGLTVFDENLVGRPELAESWEVSSDSLTWTFKIREGATYSSGRPYTADDVIFSYENTLDPDTQSIHTKGLEGVLKPIKIDDKTVQIITLAPRASMLTKITEGTSGRVLTAVDREILEQEDGQAKFNRIPAGPSWFKVKEHVFGERLELEQNPFYWDIANRPIVDSVTAFNIGEGATLVAALKAKQLDFLESYQVQFFDELIDSKGIIVDDTPDIGFQMIAFNRRADRQEKIGKSVLPSDDVRVRRAVGNALDRQAVIDRAFAGRAIPAYSPINPAMTAFFDANLAETSLQAFNLPEAKRLLAEVALERGAELGINPDGTFKIKLMTNIRNRIPAEAVQDELRRAVGIEMELELLESSVEQPRRTRGEYSWWMGGSGGDPDPDDAVDDWFADGSKFNAYGYNNERVNELNFLQKTETDVAKRRELLIEIQTVMTNDMPGAFTYHFITSNAYQDYVKGYVHTPALADLDRVWLDK